MNQMLRDPGTGTSASHADTAEVLLQKARALAPALRERAAATSQARRIPEETIASFWEPASGTS